MDTNIYKDKWLYYLASIAKDEIKYNTNPIVTNLLEKYLDDKITFNDLNDFVLRFENLKSFNEYKQHELQ